MENMNEVVNDFEVVKEIGKLPINPKIAGAGIGAIAVTAIAVAVVVKRKKIAQWFEEKKEKKESQDYIEAENVVIEDVTD